MVSSGNIPGRVGSNISDSIMEGRMKTGIGLIIAGLLVFALGTLVLVIL